MNWISRIIRAFLRGFQYGLSEHLGNSEITIKVNADTEEAERRMENLERLLQLLSMRFSVFRSQVEQMDFDSIDESELN